MSCFRLTVNFYFYMLHEINKLYSVQQNHRTLIFLCSWYPTVQPSDDTFPKFCTFVAPIVQWIHAAAMWRLPASELYCFGNLLMGLSSGKKQKDRTGSLSSSSFPTPVKHFKSSTYPMVMTILPLAARIWIN